MGRPAKNGLYGLIKIDFLPRSVEAQRGVNHVPHFIKHIRLRVLDVAGKIAHQEVEGNFMVIERPYDVDEHVLELLCEEHGLRKHIVWLFYQPSDVSLGHQDFKPKTKAREKETFAMLAVLRFL